MFDHDKVRFSSAQSLAEDILNLSHRRSEILLGYLGIDSLVEVNGTLPKDTHSALEPHWDNLGSPRSLLGFHWWGKLQTAERSKAQLNTASSLRFDWTSIHGSFTRPPVSLVHQLLRDKWCVRFSLNISCCWYEQSLMWSLDVYSIMAAVFFSFLFFK